MPKAYSPNGDEIVATCDFVPANALIVMDSFARNPDGSLSFDWVGESKMCWDGQYTKHEDGKPLYVDERGMEWTADELVLSD